MTKIKKGMETIRCPECDDNDKLRKIDDDCYRCSKCNNEWFADELIREEYKTAVFYNEENRAVFVPMTEKKRAELKKRGTWGFSTARQPPSISRKDKNLLRRLKK